MDTTTNPSTTDCEKAIDEYVEKQVFDHHFNRSWLKAHMMILFPSLLSRKEEEVRSAENAAWVARQRCGECGGEKDGNELSDMCGKCFEEA